MNDNLLDNLTTFSLDFKTEGLVKVGLTLLIVIAVGSLVFFKIKKGA